MLITQGIYMIVINKYTKKKKNTPKKKESQFFYREDRMHVQNAVMHKQTI